MKKEQIEDQVERREFIKITTKLAGIFGVLGVAGLELNASDKYENMHMNRANMNVIKRTKKVTVRNVLDNALATGNMKNAIASQGRNLSQRDRTALSKLTNNDLRQLKSIRRKLTSAGMNGGKSEVGGYVVF